MRRVRHGAGEEAVHDLRVSLRRFFAALRIFRDLFPRRHADRIRKELRLVLKLAGEVRNRDIALALAQEAGVGPRAAVTLGLHRQRKESVHVLKNALHQAESRDVAQRWRNGALA
jgi:CHAD domain-containing protein